MLVSHALYRRYHKLPNISSMATHPRFKNVSNHVRYDDCVRSNQAASTQSRVLGCGVGLLAAAAVASSPSLSSLIPIAINAVVLSYYVGSKISTMASQLDSATSEGKCWSYDMVSCSEESISQLVSSFHHDKVCPHKRSH